MTDTDRELLSLAGAFYRDESARLADARHRFGMNATQFWQRVNTLLQDPEALAADPLTVNRLRRIRATRSKVPSTRATISRT